MKPIYLAFILLLLAGCAQSFVTAQTPAQTVFATKALHATVAATTNDLLESKVITADMAYEIWEDLDATQGAIDAAVGIVRSGEVLPDTRLERIKLIQTLLQQWQYKLRQEAANVTS